MSMVEPYDDWYDSLLEQGINPNDDPADEATKETSMNETAPTPSSTAGATSAPRCQGCSGRLIGTEVPHGRCGDCRTSLRGWL